MSLPPLPDWDTNATHTTAILAGHASDGYAEDEVPDSDETNELFRRIGLWVRTFAATLGMAPDQLIGAFSSSVDPDFQSLRLGITDGAWAYCPAIGGGNIIQGSANNKVKIAAGTLLQLVGGSLVPWVFDGTDEVTIPNGDASHYRVDLVQLQITVTAGTISKAITYKQGAPATAPVYPTPDAGTVPICAIVVPTNYVGAAGLVWSEFDGPNAADTPGVGCPTIHDLRMPLGVRKYLVLAHQFSYDSTHWTYFPNTMEIQANSSPAGVVRAVCPVTKGRLVGVDIASRQWASGNGEAFLATVLFGPNGASQINVPKLATLTGLSETGAGVRAHHGGRTLIEAGPDGSEGPAVTGNGTHSPPVWCQGNRGAKEEFTLNGALSNIRSLAVCFPGLGTSGQPEYFAVVFYVAEGLG